MGFFFRSGGRNFVSMHTLRKFRRLAACKLDEFRTRCTAESGRADRAEAVWAEAVWAKAVWAEAGWAEARKGTGPDKILPLDLSPK